MDIQAVIFDVGGVLIHGTAEAGMRRWEERLGLPALGLWRRLYREGVANAADEGQMAEAAVYELIGRWYDLTEAEVAQLAAEFWDGWRLDQEMFDYFTGLRPQFKTGILSNAWSNARAGIGTAYGIEATAADMLIFSAEVGMRKPDAAIYELALKELGVAAAEAVFVDDRKENVAAAETLGMHGIRYQSTEQVIKVLDELLGQG